jgi:hypothetical protein
MSSSEKNNALQLNHNSELLDENGFYFRARLIGNQLSEKVKPFPSIMVI